MVNLTGMSMIFAALLVMSVPGAMYNNLNNNGLVVSQAQSLTCSSDPQTPTCQISGTVGCQTNTAYCTLSGSSISFLNSKSPFTQMIQGNVFALFTNINGFTQNGASQTSWSGSHGPFDITGSVLFYSADCQGLPAGASKSQTQWALGRCTQTNTDNSNVTEANVASWNNWNTNWNTTLALQFYQLGNATFTRSCSWIAQINYTLTANGPGWTYFGCTINQAPTIQTPGTNPTHRSWAYLVAMPVTYGPMPPGGSHQHLFVQLENWYTATCLKNLNLGAYTSNGCNTFLAAFTGVNLALGGSSNITFVPSSGISVFLGLVAGVILLIAGLGLSVGIGGGVSVGINRQGTKIFQVLGIGLIVWVFLYSQFATWFTTGLLPYGLDGSVGIISIFLSGLFFFGVYKQGTDS